MDNDTEIQANENKGLANEKKHRLPVPQIIIIVGLLMCLAPFVSNLYHAWQETGNVSSMTSTASSIDPATKSYLLQQAQAYNARLGGYDYEYEGDIIPYEQQLVSDGTTSMGWVEVPKAAVKAMMYHDVTDAVLASGIGHQPETSLPVGGLRSHCYLSGHSGVQQYRVFDGIRALEAGDVFALHVLGDVYAYRVTDWEIVDPSAVDVAPTDADLCTLITCTTTPDMWNPKGRIGVNDKRLLVTGERCEYDPAEFENTKPDISVYVNDNTRPTMIAIGVLLVTAAALLVGNGVRHGRQKRKR